jgi:hypothetical protein
MNSRLLGLMAASVVLTATVEAQVVRVGIWPDSLSVGQLFEYRISVDFGDAHSGFIPPDSTQWGTAFEYRGMRRIPVDAGRDSLVIRLQFFGTSDTLISPMAVRLTGMDTMTLMTPALSIHFRSLVTDEAVELRPLKPIFAFARNWWPWLMGGIALLAAFWFLYRRWRNRPVTPSKTDPPPSRPFVDPLDTLRRSLDLLDPITPLDPIGFKTWYSELGDVLRRYVEDVHGIPALESTTAELRAAFRQRGLHTDLVKPFLMVSDAADMVKFAKFNPAASDADTAMRTARFFLEAAERLDRMRIHHMEQDHLGKYGLS